MATGDPRESKDIPPGTKVACVTCFDEKLEGEVLAFDYNSKFIVISILFGQFICVFAIFVAETRKLFWKLHNNRVCVTVDFS